MNPFYFLKALFLALVDVVRGPPRGVRKEGPIRRRIRRTLWHPALKKRLMGVAALVFVGFAFREIYVSFHDEAPAWLHQQRRVGPTLVQQPVRRLLDEFEQQARQRRLFFGSIRFVEVKKDLKEAIFWNTDRLINPGFSHLYNMERSLRIKNEDLIGYYTLEGKPMHFTIKADPSHPENLALTLNLDKPMLAGATQFVFRVERRFDRVRNTRNGLLQAQLGRLPSTFNGIHAFGLCLPEGMSPTQYSPEKGALVFSNGVWTIGWINALLEPASPPLSVTFPRSR